MTIQVDWNDRIVYSSSLGITVWKQKNFRYIWASQTAQAVGSILMTIIVMVDVFKETNSVFGSGLVLALSSFGSVLAERSLLLLFSVSICCKQRPGQHGSERSVHYASAYANRLAYPLISFICCYFCKALSAPGILPHS